MSATSTNDQGGTLAPEPQDERLPVGKIVLVGGVSLAAFAIGVLWAVQIMIAERGEVVARERTKAQYVGKAEVGIVDQRMFVLENRAALMQNEKRARLDGYGWVSRKEQVIHVPIAEAMKAVAAGARAPSPQQGGSTVENPNAPVPAINPIEGEPGTQEQGGMQGQGAAGGQGAAPQGGTQGQPGGAAGQGAPTPQ